MRRILAQIFLLAIINTSSGTDDGKGTPSLEGVQKQTLEEALATQYSDLHPSHDGSGSEADITYKLISEYASSFHEDRKQEPSQTILKQGNPLQKSTKRIRRGIFGGGFSFCLFGSCKSEPSKSENYVNGYEKQMQDSKQNIEQGNRGFIPKVFNNVLCLFNTCDENKKFTHCPKLCEIPKDTSTAERCKDMGCGPKRGHQTEGTKENTPQTAVPVESTPQLPVHVENTPQTAVPVENTPQTAVPVESTPRPEVPVENTTQQAASVERFCPDSCKVATHESAVKICMEIGCQPKPKQKYLVFINNTYDDSYPKHCPEMCKTPRDNATVQTCQEAGCIQQVIYIKLPNIKDEADIENFCNEWCISPANDLILKTCKAVGCNTENRKKEISNPEDSTDQTVTTPCPDSCQSPKDDSIAMLCQAIDCKPKLRQKYLVFINNSDENSYPKHCPEKCKTPRDNATVHSCQEIGCIKHVVYIKLPNMKDDAALENFCNEWCISPANDLILKTCNAIGCNTENTKTEISNPEDSTDQTATTYCPDSCQSPKDDLIAMLCQAIDCAPSMM